MSSGSSAWNEKPRPGEVSASEAYAASARWDDVAESQQAPLEAAYQRFVREHPQGKVPVSQREKNREQLMLWKGQVENPPASAKQVENQPLPTAQVEQPSAAATHIEEPPATTEPSKSARPQQGFNWGGLLIVSSVIGYLLVGAMWVRSVRRSPPPSRGDKLSLPQAYDLHIMAGPRIATAGRWTLFDYIQHVVLWPRLEYRSYQFQLQAMAVNKPQTALAATISVVLKRLIAETLCVAAVIALPMFWFTDDQVWLRNGTRLAAIILWTPLTVAVGLVISPVFWVVHLGIEPLLRLFAVPSTRD